MELSNEFLSTYFESSHQALSADIYIPTYILDSRLVNYDLTGKRPLQDEVWRLVRT